MVYTNVFYSIPGQNRTKVATVESFRCSLADFLEVLQKNESIPIEHVVLATAKQIYRAGDERLPTTYLRNNSTVHISIPIPGGKGGFGSLLRAIGAQIEKTTNRDACRDLSGRRLRDVKREDELKKLVALREKLIEEQKQRKKDKLDKLKKKTEFLESGSSINELIAMFNDKEYNERRLGLDDIIDAAVEKGIINFRKRQREEEEGGTLKTNVKHGKFDNANCDKDDNNTSAPQSTRNRNDLWLGLDEEEDGSDEDFDENRNKA